MLLRELSKGDNFTLARTGDNYTFLGADENHKGKFKVRESVKTNMKNVIGTLDGQCKVEKIEQVANWYFTFGFGQNYEGCYHKIVALESSAEHAMNARFGKNWSMMYSEEQFKGQVDKYNLREIK